MRTQEVKLVLLFAASCCPAICATAVSPDSIDLAGTWSLKLDPEDQGIAEEWFSQSLPHQVQLPGSIQFQGFGDPPTLDTQWTGSIRPEVIRMPRYAPYRDPAHFKMPFWLQPKSCYVGPVWYQRVVNIPPTWTGRRITLRLQRCHWFTQVWIDDQQAGAQDSLSVPHVYDLTAQLVPGKHTLTIRVDNRVHIKVGDNSHSVTDHTQTNWNGIIGDIQLQSGSSIWIADVQVFPDVEQQVARVLVQVNSSSAAAANMQLHLAARQNGQVIAVASTPLYIEGSSARRTITLRMGPDIQLWSEQAPHLCTLSVSLAGDAVSDAVSDRRNVTFGMRQISTRGTRFLLNGQPMFFRGTLECCIFPLTGFPPTDIDSWKRIVGRCKEYGLNHIRFHSWCPPEAAFEAADQLGFYFQVECASWANGGASVGDGTPLDEWLYREADRILRAYGNHPSFVLLAYGNEPAGPGPRGQGEDYLGKWVHHYKQRATRQLVTCASGWPYIPESQFHVMHHPLRQHGLFNRQTPETTKDYRAHVQDHSVPLISHETGQWCVFPDLEEIKKYTGVLEAKNFEIVHDFLREHHLLQQAREFLIASGKFQTLLYKEEIEVMLRTPGLGGFQLLDLHDFPGQGTALIGVLDPFWDPKPYVTAEEFRRFCGPVVPLARLASRTWTADQTLDAEVEVSQFSDADLLHEVIEWTLRSDSEEDTEETICEGRWLDVDLPRGGLRAVGKLACDLSAVKRASRLNLSVSIAGTKYRNDWDIWVYPKNVATAAENDVLVARTIDDRARTHLSAGGKILFLPATQAIAGDGHGAFEAIFWNRLWFPTQQVHTLGILCHPAHPALSEFPTDNHSNWQWWDLCNRSKPVILDELPEDLSPIVQVIDDWNTCRKLGLVFEARLGGGKLLFCSIDLENDLPGRPVARQLRHSLLRYMAGNEFDPVIEITSGSLQKLLRQPTRLQQLEALIRADHEHPDYQASNAVDGNPDTFWHTDWGPSAARYPHELIIDMRLPQAISGLTYLPRQDMSNGRIARFAIFVSLDGKQWGAPVAAGEWQDGTSLKTIRFTAETTVRYVKLVAESEVHGNAFAAVAELDVIQ